MSKKRLIIFSLVLSALLIGSLIFISLSGGHNLPVENIGQVSQLEGNSEPWGLGKEITAYVSNDRPYSWFIDQGSTGRHSANNCGPATIAMVGLWVDKTFSESTKDIRKSFSPDGGWWYSDDIKEALTKYDISYQEIPISDHHTLIDIIDSLSIAILNNNMGAIPYNPNLQQRTQRFYGYDSGHYFILKGYVIVDNTVFFEVYDPNNWGMTYDDGEPMGKNRYYAADDLIDSVMDWYPLVVVIYPGQ